MHHSDRGGTYASEDSQKILAVLNITCSMSRRGDCCDNAVLESFFSTVKSELADRFGSEAKMERFDYLERTATNGAPSLEARADQFFRALNERVPY